jgi:putative transposase
LLRYKAIARAVRYEVVDEAYSTQTCSPCGSLPETRPRGIAGLGIKSWVCSCCNALHDRNVNAAVNILAVALGG